MVKNIVEKLPDEVVQRDLKKYQQRALELGATDAKVIETDLVVIDERVRAKCFIPVCHRLGTNLNCPPNTFDLDFMRRVVANYRYALFTLMEVPSRELAGPESIQKRLNAPSARKNHEMISKIEAEAFYDGYYLAMGLANGSCKTPFCPELECQALVRGQPCRNPLKSRPSMEAVGMDAYLMAARVGWNVYPVGISLAPSEVPHGVALGLVLLY